MVKTNILEEHIGINLCDFELQKAFLIMKWKIKWKNWTSSKKLSCYSHLAWNISVDKLADRVMVLIVTTGKIYSKSWKGETCNLGYSTQQSYHLE